MRKLRFLLAASGLITIVGCNDAFSDNPVNADKMNKIRQQEGNGRANFNPSSSAPPGGASTPPKTGG